MKSAAGNSERRFYFSVYFGDLFLSLVAVTRRRHFAIASKAADSSSPSMARQFA
jgi:hypothetical protein